MKSKTQKKRDRRRRAKRKRQRELYKLNLARDSIARLTGERSFPLSVFDEPFLYYLDS